MKHVRLEGIGTVICIAMMVIFIACSGETDVDTSQTSSAPTQTASIQFALNTDVPEPPNPKAVVRYSTLLVDAFVADVLPSRWTTDDGIPPSDVADALNNGTATILTPIVLSLQGDAIINRDDNDLPSNQIVLLVEGGQVGEVEVTSNIPWREYQAGEHVLVSAYDVTLDSTKAIANWANGIPDGFEIGWIPTAKWRIEDPNTAIDFTGTAQSLDVLVSTLVSSAIEFPSRIPMPTPNVDPTSTDTVESPTTIPSSPTPTSTTISEPTESATITSTVGIPVETSTTTSSPIGTSTSQL